MRLSWLPLGYILLASSVQALPAIEHWTTPNGARVFFAQARELPLVDIRVVFDAGSARDGSKSGLARLTNALLAEGAGPLSADAVAERLADQGAQLKVDSGRDAASVSLRTLSTTQRLQSAAAVLATVIGSPKFSTEAMERVRDQMLVAVRQDEQSPAATGQRELFRLLFRDHPYAQDPGGEEDTLRAIANSDLFAFHQRYYVARNAVVAMVGDLDRTAAEALAQRITSELMPGEASAPLPRAPVLAEVASERIPFPAEQVHLFLGQVGVSYREPEFYPLYVGNHILGGSGLVSLLFEQLREQRGLVYSVSSAFSPLRARGPFVLAMQTRHDQAALALAVVRTTLMRFLSHGPSAEQLASAKRNIVGGFPLQLDSNRKLLNYIGLIGFHRLPLDYLERFTKEVEMVSAESIRTAFSRRMRPDAMVTVSVGPAGAPYGRRRSKPSPVAKAAP